MQEIWQDNVDPDNMTYEVCFAEFMMVFCFLSGRVDFFTSITRHELHGSISFHVHVSSEGSQFILCWMKSTKYIAIEPGI